MEITWDDAKAQKNSKKHKGVTFEEATAVFFDALAQQFTDPHEDANRMVIIGMGTKRRLLLVVYAEILDEKITIISARLPTKNERKFYEEGI
ncbi:MAG: BrnT family toxin [Bdellovibrionia bacterium]